MEGSQKLSPRGHPTVCGCLMTWLDLWFGVGFYFVYVLTNYTYHLSSSPVVPSFRSVIPTTTIFYATSRHVSVILPSTKSSSSSSPHHATPAPIPLSLDRSTVHYINSQQPTFISDLRHIIGTEAPNKGTWWYIVHEGMAHSDFFWGGRLFPNCT